MTNKDRIMLAIRQQIKLHEDNRSEYAREIGVSPQYISQLLNGKNPLGSLSVDMLEKLFPEIIEVTFNWKKTTPIREQLLRFVDSLNGEEQERALEMLKAAFLPNINKNKEGKKENE